MRRGVAFLSVMALGLTTGFIVQAQAKTELKLAWWGSSRTEDRYERTSKVVEMYEAEHPDIDIVYEDASFGDYWAKLNIQARDNDLPCIMQQDYIYIAEWAKRDLLMPLDSLVETGTLDLSDVPEVALQGGHFNDKLYGVSLGTNSQAIIIDVDAFEAAGLELPPTDWTWTDFEEIATTLHEKTGRWAITLDGLSGMELWISLVLADGASPFNEDGTGFGYSDDQSLVDYFDMLLRLQDAGVIASLEEGEVFRDADPEDAPIVTKKVAMAYQWSNQVSAFFSAAGDDRHFRLWPLPRPAGKASANYLKPAMFFSITSSCRYPKEAAKFISYFINSTEANDVLLADRGVPISTKVYEYLLPKLDPDTAEIFNFLKVIEADSRPIFAEDPPELDDFNTDVWIPLIRNIFSEQISLKEGIATLRRAGSAILAKNKAK